MRRREALCVGIALVATLAEAAAGQVVQTVPGQTIVQPPVGGVLAPPQTLPGVAPPICPPVLGAPVQQSLDPYAICPPPAAAVVVAQPAPPTGGFFGGFEATFLEPHVSTVSFDLGGNPVNLTPEFDMEFAPRAWIGYEFADGFGIRGRWWNFDGETSDASLLGMILPNFTLGLDHMAIDVEGVQRIERGAWEVLLSGGVRYGQQELSVSGETPAMPPEAFELTADYDGLGPTLAAEVRRTLFGGFGVFAIGRGSLLFGDTDISGSGAAAPINNANLQITEQVMRVWEFQVGVEWRTTFRYAEFFLRGALEGQSWESGSVLGLVDTDIGYFGPTAAIGISR